MINMTCISTLWRRMNLQIGIDKGGLIYSIDAINPKYERVLLSKSHVESYSLQLE